MSFNSTKLPNGLNILTYSIPTINSVNISIIIRVGSRYETLDESGINRLLTNIAFKGTKNHSAIEIAKKFKSIGEYHYAISDRECSIYSCKILSQYLEEGLTILKDSLLDSVFDEKNIQKHLSINDNVCLSWSKIFGVAYGEQHPLGREERKNITIHNTQTLKNYIAKHYHINNFYVVMVGNIEQNNVVKLTEKLFSKSNVYQKSHYLPANYLGGYYQKETKSKITDIVLGFESNSHINIKEFYYEEIISKILHYRLLKRINEDLDLDCHINVLISTLSDTSLFQIIVTTEEDNAKILLQNIILEINNIKINIIKEELEEVKIQSQSSISLEQDDPNHIEHEIMKNFNLFGKYFSSQEILNVISTTTISDLIPRTQKIFSRNPSLVITGLPIKNFDFQSIKNNLLR